MLSQNIDSLSMPDGMDLSVALVDLNTSTLSITSAMNPVFLKKGSELIYLKASRYSIGGKHEDHIKVFEDNVFHMEKGDKLYFLSDGYVDQFGGPEGKKYKISGLKKTLQEISPLSMTRQYEYLSREFDRWKGDLDQIDDILIMGIEF